MYLQSGPAAFWLLSTSLNGKQVSSVTPNMDSQVILNDNIHISGRPDWTLASMLRYVHTAADNMEIEQVIRYAMNLS